MSSRHYVLRGMPDRSGNSKSQIVIQYAHEIRAQSRKTSIFWVHGGSKARFAEGYRGIADRAQLFNSNSDEQDVLAMARGWLDNEANGEWLMIVDNADDAKVFFGAEGGPDMAQFLPKTGRGSIIFTSRSMDTAEKLVGGDNIYKVPTMLPTQALDLLRNGLGEIHPDEEAPSLELVHELGLIPLAISQAAAYIRRRKPRISVLSYLNEIRQNDGRARMLLNEAVDHRRDPSASNSLVSTWQLTLHRVHHERHTATDLLTLMSFFNPQSIPDFALKEYVRDWRSHDDLQKDLDILCGYSLVTVVGARGDMFAMHPLVQFCTQLWRSQQGDIPTWTRVFLSVMSAVYPYGMYDNWHICQVLEPHITSLFTFEPRDAADAQKWARLLANAGHYRLSTGRHKQAEFLLQQALAADRRFLGEDHIDTHRVQVELYMAQLDSGSLCSSDEAEFAVRDMLVSNLQSLGPDHPGTLDTAYRLGGVLASKGAIGESEMMLRATLEASTRVLGRGSLMTVDTAHALAQVCLRKNNFVEGEEILRSAQGMAVTGLGEMHPATLDVGQSLGRAVAIQGRLSEAEDILKPVLESKKAVLGPEHLSTLESLELLGCVMGLRSKVYSAATMLGQVHDARCRQLGVEHPRSLDAASGLGSALMCQRRYRKAEYVMRHVLEVRERVLGMDASLTCMAAAELSLVLQHQKCESEAALHHERASRGLERLVGPDHPAVVALNDRYRKMSARMSGRKG